MSEPSAKMMQREKRFLEDVLDHLDGNLWTAKTLLQCRLDTLNSELAQSLPAAAAQPQRESEPRQCSCPIERCDGPKSANEYCTAHPPKQFERESEQPEQALREALDGWIEAHQRLDHTGITDCTRCKRIAEIQSGFKLAALSPQTDSQEPR